MPEYTKYVKVAEDLGVGMAAGALDQWLQNKDNERAKDRSTQDPPGELPLQSQYSAYLNFGLPILDVVAVAMGWLKGDWACRMTTVSGQLAGRKLAHKFSNEKHLKGYPGSDNAVGYSASSEYQRARELEAHRAAARSEAERRRAREIPTVTGVGAGSVMEI